MPREEGNAGFCYAWDPLCLASLALYAINRFLIKPHLPPHEFFLRGHLNDLLLVPAALPFFLTTYKWLGLRRDDRPPTAREILAHLVMWSFCFEIAGPGWLHRSTSDPWDVAAYALGAALAYVFWNRLQRQHKTAGQGLVI